MKISYLLNPEQVATTPPATPAPESLAALRTPHRQHLREIPLNTVDTEERFHLSRDERHTILVLREANYTYGEIVEHFKRRGYANITYRQVEYTCQQNRPTPKKRSGRPSILTVEQVDQIEEFIRASRDGRRMSYGKIIEYFTFDVKESALRRALKARGYSRCVALRKPPITEATRQLRLAFAQAHLHWTIDEWGVILWTDETWVTSGRHRKIWVTRKAGE